VAPPGRVGPVPSALENGRSAWHEDAGRDKPKLVTLRRVDAVLVGAFAAVVLAFVGATVITQRRTREIESAALSIQGNAAPSIRYLADARTELRRLQLLIHRALAQPAPSSGALEIETGRALLDAELAAYRDLPLYSSEAVVWRRSESTLARFDEQVGDLLDRIRHGDRAGALKAEERIDAMGEDVARALSAGIDADIVVAAELAGAIRESRQRGTVWAFELNSAGVLLAIFAAAVGLRISHAHARAVEEVQKSAERRATELDVFATRMAHDIRNPLAAAALIFDDIARRADGDDKLSRAAERGRRAIAHTAAVVEALLEFARAGARPAPGATAAPADVAEEIATLMRSRADQIGADLQVQTACRARVACSAGMLSSALGNLVGNALTYVEGAAERKVTISVEPRGNDVRIAVADTGPGLPAGLDPATLFQPYVRGPQARGRGLGLGLSTVSRIVEAHGGQLGVESTAAGCCFWFTLPRAADESGGFRR
jgi:signal transduction histidine kinase